MAKSAKHTLVAPDRTPRTRPGIHDDDLVMLFRSTLNGTHFGYQRRHRSCGTIIVPMMLRENDEDWTDITDGRLETPGRDWPAFIKSWLTGLYAPVAEEVVWL